MKVVLEKESIFMSKHIAFANVFLDLINDEYYPQYKWNDFASIILSWWAQEAIKLVRDDLDYASFNFMDGDYEFRIYKVKYNTYSLTFVEDQNENSYHGNNIDMQLFLESLKNSIEVLLEVCASNKKIDIRGFDNHIKEIELLLQQHNNKSNEFKKN